MYAFTFTFDTEKHYILYNCIAWVYDGCLGGWVDGDG